jgi:predicted GNAT superfamily acetyltransferase
VQAAGQQAARAAHRSAVTVRTVDQLGDLHQVAALFDEVWGTSSASGSSVIGVEHLRALSYTGGYVGAAYDSDTLVAASVGFFAAPPGRVLHSDVTGVRRRALGRQVGFAVKLHQRAWALAQGIQEITWTFDPLLSRNAHFNLARLRATATRYEPDFYGEMPDRINVGQGSDRLLASWRIGSAEVVAACERGAGPAEARDRGSAPAVLAESAGRPVVTEAGPEHEHVRIEVPADIEAVRRADPALGRAWRLAVRNTLGTEMTAGSRVVTFERGAGYLVARRSRFAHPGG